MKIINLLKKIPKMGLLGAGVGAGVALAYEFTARVINPRITIAHTYSDNDGKEFYDATSYAMTTRDRLDKPSKLNITIERRH